MNDTPVRATTPSRWRSTGSPRQTGTLFVVASGNSGDVYRHPSRRRRRAHRRRRRPRQQAGLVLYTWTALDEQRGQARHHRPWCRHRRREGAQQPQRRQARRRPARGDDRHVDGVTARGSRRGDPRRYYPQWKATDLKAALMNSANPESERDRLRTGRRLSGRGAKAGEKAPSPPLRSAPSAWAGPQWPHHDDKPISHTITYRNCGSGPTSRSTWP